MMRRNYESNLCIETSLNLKNVLIVTVHYNWVVIYRDYSDAMIVLMKNICITISQHDNHLETIQTNHMCIKPLKARLRF